MDLIKLLPDSIASQIAAGEVIQRPSSVVKELLENSVDAGSDEITLVIKDSGKTLIQVSDNGSGMSETDARMSFERHATSKISTVQDIFKIHTKGFRGEALASIASVAQVEMITRKTEKELGTRILIDGSVVKKQENIQSEAGTKISVRNLFYNIPARRKFLKTDTVEWKHITDEFVRIALAHTEISFNLYHNGNLVYQLLRSGLKPRILNVLNKGLDSKILPVEEDMELFKVKGYIGNIDLLQKSKNNQFLFVNKRYIKNNYLNHAITSAYSEFNMFGENPFYILFIDIDPAMIDINVHPTKQEIKFEEEKLIYNYLKVAIKHVIGKNIFVPKIEFDENATFRHLQEKSKNEDHKSYNIESKINKITGAPEQYHQDWEKVYEIVKSKKDSFDNFGKADPEFSNLPQNDNISDYDRMMTNGFGSVLQVFDNYFVLNSSDSLYVVNVRAAMERINYDRIYLSLERSIEQRCRQLLFPVVIHLEEDNIILNNEFTDQLNKTGFECERVLNKLMVKAVPEFIDDDSVKELIESSIESYVSDIDFRYAFIEKFALKACKSVKNKLKNLSEPEISFILKNLFNSSNKMFGPGGEKIIFKFKEPEFIRLLIT
ncbi:MAG: DNA mismatch repair endonuclease MutL [Deltaproteobacteria bacterium]